MILSRWSFYFHLLEQREVTSEKKKIVFTQESKINFKFIIKKVFDTERREANEMKMSFFTLITTSAVNYRDCRLTTVLFLLNKLT